MSNRLNQDKKAIIMDLNEVVENCLEWSNETFGSDRAAIKKMYHLKQEVDEVIGNLEYQESMHPDESSKQDDLLLVEYADCAMLLFTSIRAKGFTINDLTKALSRKLEINKQRDWGVPDKNGVINHL